MAEKTLPRYILRDCMLWADRESQLGQIGEITPPVPEAKREGMRNAGMIKERNVHLGYNALEFSFKMPGLDPQILKLFGLKPGAPVLQVERTAYTFQDRPVEFRRRYVDTRHCAYRNVRGLQD